MVIAKGCFAIKGQKAPSSRASVLPVTVGTSPAQAISLIFNAASKVH